MSPTHFVQHRRDAVAVHCRRILAAMSIAATVLILSLPGSQGSPNGRF